MTVAHSKRGERSVKAYVCGYHRDRGGAVCGNTLRRPMEGVDAAVAGWFLDNVLSDEVMAAVLREVRKRLAAQKRSGDSDIPALNAEVRKLEAEIDRMTEALASGGDKPEAVIKAIAGREKRLHTLRARIDARRASPSVIDMHVRRLEAEASSRLQQMRELLSGNPEEGRKDIKALLDGHLTFTPVDTTEGKHYLIEGATSFGALFATESFQTLASPAGFEPEDRTCANYAAALGLLRMSRDSWAVPERSESHRMTSSDMPCGRVWAVGGQWRRPVRQRPRCMW
jgi:site-specific DNA recombinase